MFKLIAGGLFSYLMFNENGRKIANNLGDKIILMTKTGVNKIGNTENKQDNNNSTNDNDN